MKFENGKSLEISAVKQSDKNVYVQKIELNGKKLEKWTLSHADLTNGGTLKFYMGPKPKR